MSVAGIAAALACGSSTTPGPAGPLGPEIGILMIGNSLTYTNDLPRTLKDMAKSGGVALRVESVAAPDFALIDHLNGRSNALTVIARGGWEYVILQQGPSTLAVNRDSLVLWTQMFDQRIKAVSARTALFMVWPAQDRPQSFPDVRTSYQLAAQSVGGIFLPAGEAWLAAWERAANLQLYGADGFHPAPLGTYLAAAVIYEQITGKDARQLPAQAVVAGVTLSASQTTVRALQQAAHDTNLRFPSNVPH